ncbi:hypothetical protein [Hyphobacterium sp.]|uniref:hypothetical protein n=1 Tax=Hyphobacterium sp. TaxID=2004662 RepID=UPI00374911F1
MNYRATMIISSAFVLAAAGIYVMPVGVTEGDLPLSENVSASEVALAVPIVWPTEELIGPNAEVQTRTQQDAPPPPPPPREPQISLLGITRDGSIDRAWVRVDQQPATGLSVGDEVERWMVAQIQTTNIVLVSGEERRELRLFE